MKKIKYIIGDGDHINEIHDYFVNQQCGDVDFYSYLFKDRAYYIDPVTHNVHAMDPNCWVFKALVEAGVFVELKYPYTTKPILKVIQGDPNRGDDVIAYLVSLGGKNNIYQLGKCSNGYYYIGENNSIESRIKTDEFFNDYELEIMSLPEKVNPKLKVIQGVPGRGSEVISLLESLGGKNENDLEGRFDDKYYFVDGDGCMGSGFFDDYELEIMSLPEKVKPTLQVIPGDWNRASEVIALLENRGGINEDGLEGCIDCYYYYIGEQNLIEVRTKSSKFFNNYELDILSLPEKVEKPKLQVIQGYPDRGDEVIKLLESMGGVNDRFDGDCEDWYYFIKDGQIAVAFTDSDFFNDYELEILTLPEKVEKAEKPKLKVIEGDPDRGDEVIKLLESLGGVNSYNHLGKDIDNYYFIDPRYSSETIISFRYNNAFFKDYELEIMSLPEKEEKVKKPKLKVIKGAPGRGSEVISLLESLGGKNVDHLECCFDDTYYFIDGDMHISCTVDMTGRFFDKYDIEILTLPEKAEKVEKPKLKVIQGVLGRGHEVVKLLESMGGKNADQIYGGHEKWYYYIDEHNSIRFELKTSKFFDKFDLEIMSLPKKPKLQVIKGDADRGNEVIGMLQFLGGHNIEDWAGNNDSCYYFINHSDYRKPIMFDGCDSAYFNNYELEILTLPDKVEKPKLQVIKGDKNRGREVIKFLEDRGGINDNSFWEGCNIYAYYFIVDGHITCKKIDNDYFNNYDLEILELPKKKVKLQVIKGDDDRDNDVIAFLEDLGGINFYGLGGGNICAYYFIDGEGHIMCKKTDHDYFNNYELEILELPKKVEKPKLQVIKGDKKRGREVIKFLEDRGGDNSVRKNNGIVSDAYYYLDRDKTICCKYIDDKFFDDYDLEVLTLDECKVVTYSSKAPMILEPFVTHVLVRTKGATKWLPGIYVCQKEIDGDTYYIIAGSWSKFKECIPYEGNEHLLLTTTDPEEENS